MVEEAAKPVKELDFKTIREEWLKVEGGRRCWL